MLGRPISLLLFVLLLTGLARADPLIDALSVGVGRSVEGVDIARLGARQTIPPEVVDQRFGDLHGWLGGYLEGSANFWQHDQKSAVCVALSPVFVCYLGGKDWSHPVRPYIEAGAGPSYVSDIHLGSCNFGCNYQFEDRAGIGVKWDRWDVSTRVMHYSNCGIDKHNSGITMLVASATKEF